MRLFKEEILLIRNISREINLKLTIEVIGNIDVSLYDGEDVSIYRLSSDKCTLSIGLSSMDFSPPELKEKIQDIVGELYETFLDNLMWSRNIHFNDIRIYVARNKTWYKDRYLFFEYLFKEYLISKNSKSAMLFYINNGLYYSCILFRDMNIVSIYYVKDQYKIRNINVHTNPLDYLFKMKTGTKFFAMSPNYETPTRQSYFNQLSRLKTEETSICVKKEWSEWGS